MSDTKTPDTNTDPNGGGIDDQAAAGAGEPQKGKKKEFDTETREFIESHGNSMFGKGYSKAEAVYESRLSEAMKQAETLQQELETLRKGATQKPEGGADQAADITSHPEFKKLQGQFEELRQGVTRITSEKEQAVEKLNSYESERREAKIKNEFMDAIPAGIEFFDTREVFSLLRPVMSVDDKGNVIVLNPKTGTARFGRNMQDPMTLGELVSEFAEQRQYMVKAGNDAGGTGAGETKRQPGASTGKKSVSEMSDEEFEAHIAAVKAGEAAA